MLPILLGVGGFFALRHLLNKTMAQPNRQMSPMSTMSPVVLTGPGTVHYDYPPGYTGVSVSAPPKPANKVYHVAPGDTGSRVWGRFIPSVLPDTFKALNPNITDWIHLTGVTQIILPPTAIDKGPAAQATGTVT
jgi:hypothetical protein